MAKPCSGVAGSITGTFAKEPNRRVSCSVWEEMGPVQRHERIGSDIEPHLLAGEQHPRAAVGRAGQHLERRLLVGGPFHMHVLGRARRVQLRHGFHQLGRWRAGIPRHHVHSGL